MGHPRFIRGYAALAEALSDTVEMPVKQLQRLVYQGVIPHKRIGHRTVLFELDKVIHALVGDDAS